MFVVGTVAISFPLRTSELLALGHRLTLIKMTPRQGCVQPKWFICILFLAILVISSTILTILITSSCYFHIFCPIEYEDGRENLLQDPIFWSIILSSIILMIVLIFIAVKIININRINEKLSKIKPLEMKPINNNNPSRSETREQYQKVRTNVNRQEEAIYIEVS